MILTHDFLKNSLQHGIFESYGSNQQQVIYKNNDIFRKHNQFDIFLSHSSLDREEVINLVGLFNNCGYSVYVDWMYDAQLDRSNVTEETAEALRTRMLQSTGLAYLATGNSANSKWCPWELGYFDGKSQTSRCCILPVLSYKTDHYTGQEYLGLYPYLVYEQYSNSSDFDFWVCEQGSSKYIVLREWLKNNDPYAH